MNTDLIQLLPLNSEQLNTVYYHHMLRDFPDSERKPLRMIRKALTRGEYECLGLFLESALVGYAFLVRLGHDYLLDYYAITAELRGKGCGSTCLSMLQSHLSGAETVIIEAEHPAYAKTDSDRVTQRRRMNFYLRNGCTDTGAAAAVFGVEYVLLELPVSVTHTAEEIRKVYARIYRSFLSQTQFDAHILLR